MSNKGFKYLKLNKIQPMDYYLPVNTPKEQNKVILRIEKIIRSSTEYKDYILFLKENFDMNECAFFKGVVHDSEHKNVRIEIHHEPFTLRDYVQTVLTKWIEEGNPINELYIAEEVMQIHYKNMVGLIPLSRTMHQMAHKSSKCKIPLNCCYGNYLKFLQEYEDYVDDALYDKLERKINETKNLTEEDFAYLTKEFTYIETEGVSEAKKLVEDNIDDNTIYLSA